MSRREFTGVGFWTFLEVAPSAPRIPGDKSFELSVLGEIEGLRLGACFVLFVRDGVLKQLEGSTYGDEMWPTPAFKLGYHVGGQMEKIQYSSIAIYGTAALMSLIYRVIYKRKYGRSPW